MPQIKLANQRIQSTNVASPLPAMVINAGSRGRINSGAGMINPNVADVKYTDVPQKPYVQDDTMKNVLNLENVIVKRTQELTEQKNKLLATEAITQYQEYARMKFYGDSKNKINGYSQYQGVDALDNYDYYNDDLDKKQQQLLNNLDPAARKHAVIGMQDIKNRYLNKGATHHTKQLQVAEEQKLYYQGKVARDDISTKGSESWTDGSIQNYLNTIKDAQRRDSEASTLSEHTLFTTFNQDELNNTPIAERIKNIQKVHDVLAKSVYPETGEFVISGIARDKLDKRTIDFQRALAKELDSNNKKIQEQYISQLKKEAPMTLANALIQGNSTVTNNVLNNINKIDGIGALPTLIDKSFDYAVNNGGFQSYQQAFRSIDMMTENIKDNPNIPEGIKIYTENKAIDYKNKAFNRFEKKAKMDTISLGIKLQDMPEEDLMKLQYIPPPDDYTDKQKEKWNKIQESVINERIHNEKIEIDPKTSSILSKYNRMAEMGDLTSADVQEIRELSYSGKIPISIVSKIEEKFNEQQQIAEQMKPIKRDPIYKAGIKTIDNALKGSKLYRVKDFKKGTKEYNLAILSSEIDANELKTELAKTILYYKKKGMPFDLDQWLQVKITNYRKKKSKWDYRVK